jgi:hypothetical protein
MVDGLGLRGTVEKRGMFLDVEDWNAWRSSQQGLLDSLSTNIVFPDLKPQLHDIIVFLDLKPQLRDIMVFPDLKSQLRDIIVFVDLKPQLRDIQNPKS